MNILAVGTAEVESLKGALAKAKKETKANKVAADKAAKALEEEKTTRRKHEVQVEEIEQELKDAIARCESLGAEEFGASPRTHQSSQESEGDPN